MILPQFYIDDLIKNAITEDINYIDVATDYLIELEGGKKYYLHMGYYKNGSTNTGSDTFTINNIKLNDELLNYVPEISPYLVGTQYTSVISGLGDVVIDYGRINGSYQTCEISGNLEINGGVIYYGSYDIKMNIGYNNALIINGGTINSQIMNNGVTTIINNGNI